MYCIAICKFIHFYCLAKAVSCVPSCNFVIVIIIATDWTVLFENYEKDRIGKRFSSIFCKPLANSDQPKKLP